MTTRRWGFWLLLSVLVPAGAGWAVAPEIPSALPAYQLRGVGMAPMRALIDWLPADTEWDPATRSLHLLARGPEGVRRITLRAEVAEARANGELLPLPRAPFMAHTGFYAPIRPVLEALGGSAEWSDAPRGLTISYGPRLGFLPFMAPVHPVVNRDNVLLGGLTTAGWVDGNAMATLLDGSERYWGWTPAAALPGELAGVLPVRDEVTEHQAVKLPWSDGAHPEALALAAPWDALPRQPRRLATADSLYLPAVVEILKAHGLPQAKPVLRQVMLVDLDGDGVDEVLLAGGNLDPARPPVQAKPGDYTFVALRQVVEGEVRTTLLDGTFVTAPTTPVNVVRISTVLDLDGDGTLEVVVGWAYYEGQGTDVHQLVGGVPRIVLAGGFGV